MSDHSPDNHPAPSAYVQAFSKEMRAEMKEDDRQAWSAIVTLLLGIICTGVLLAVVCVLITTS